MPVNPQKAIELVKQNRDLFEAELKRYGVDIENVRNRRKGAE